MKLLPSGMPYRPSAQSQRGVVLLISLIILAVLLAAGAALVRSFDTSLFQAGNLAFRRDLTNQAGRVTPVVLGYFQSGTLATLTGRADNQPTVNYSATMLPSNAQGIPNALLNSNFDNLPLVTAGNTIAVAIDGVDQQVRVRYLIDRMCMTTGDETTLGDRCVRVELCERAGTAPCVGPSQVNYRISIRVDGPRNTQAFFQSTLSL